MANKDQKQAKQTKKKDDFSACQVDTNAIDPDDVDVNSPAIQLPQRPVQTRKAEAESPKKSGKGSPRRRSRPKGSSRSGTARGTEADRDAQDRNGDFEHVTIPEVLGIMALRNAVIFPGTVIPLAVGRPRSNQLLADVLEDSSPRRPGEALLGVLAQRDPAHNEPGYDDLYTMGTVVTVLKVVKQPDGQKSVVIHGLVRFRVLEWISQEPYLKARIEVITSEAVPSKGLEALLTSVRHAALKMVELSPNIPDEVSVILTNIDDPAAMADFLAANLNIPTPKKQEILETLDVTERLQKLSVALAGQVELLELSAKIQQRVSRSIDKSQREYFLQEQLKAIQNELGQTDQRSAEIEELRERIENAQMPEKVNGEALRELERLGQIPTMSPEFAVVRNYIEWLCELPWAVATKDKLDLPRAKRILNTDHYDLTKIKKRILEFLAVRKLNPTGRSPILCLCGPPGVGKTSLGKSIARSMGRKFVRVSLGGIRDEADIRGHRRTYIGALPGRIIQELRKCGSNNPVFMLDELDKIGADFRGDPASALLEVLDPEQNNSFTDHYIDQPFDLSHVMFIGTANYMGTVPPPLRDRMEVLELPGYTAREKLMIAKRYLVPRQLKENGLTKTQLTLRDNTLERIIDAYTREAGVRELERKIAAVCRAIAAEIASNKRKSATIAPRQLAKLLGPAQYESELAMRTSVPGVATGLAYTPVGGEILFIESTLTPGSGRLILTGQLGDVMKESAQTAFSALKSLAVGKPKRNGVLARVVQAITQDQGLKKQDIHVHVPAGAVPKDGPSAGLAMYLSLASLLSDQPMRAEVAMTGEVTLRGQVLPVGGIKEKLLAAKRAGIQRVILPERNRKDLAELDKEVTASLDFKFVKHVDKALPFALEQDT